MSRARRFSKGLSQSFRASLRRMVARRKVIAILVGGALLLSLLMITPVTFLNHPVAQAQSGTANGQGSRVAAPAPLLGPPEANLPNLDEVRRRLQAPPEAPLGLPSSQRARRNPLAPRNGKRVGDPGTTLGAQLSMISGRQRGDSIQLSAIGVSIRGSSPTVREGSAIRIARFNHAGSRGDRTRTSPLTKRRLTPVSQPLTPVPSATINTCRLFFRTRWRGHRMRPNKLTGTTFCGRLTRRVRPRW